MDCSMPGFPVHHQLLELAQIHVHRVNDAIQPSHPLSSPSLPTFNISQYQGHSNESVLHISWPKYWVSASASVLPMNIQNWYPLGWTGWISLQSKGLSRVFSHPDLIPDLLLPLSLIPPTNFLWLWLTYLSFFLYLCPLLTSALPGTWPR